MPRPLGIQVLLAQRWLRQHAEIIGGLAALVAIIGVTVWGLSGAPERARQDMAQREIAAAEAAAERAARKESREMERLGRRITKRWEAQEADPRTATAMVFEPPLTDMELAAQDQWETECDECRSCSGDYSEKQDEQSCQTFCRSGDRGGLVESYVGSGCLCKNGWHRWNRSHCYISPGFDCTPYGFNKHYDPRFGMIWSWKRPRSWQPGVCRWRRDASS